MSTIIYNPSGDELTLQQVLQAIADGLQTGRTFPEKLFIYGNFNKTPASLANALETVNFSLSGLEDALGLLVAHSFSSLSTKEQLLKLFGAYRKHPAPSLAVRHQITLSVSQWAQQRMMSVEELNDVYEF
jgi:hypothetical protein